MAKKEAKLSSAAPVAPDEDWKAEDDARTLMRSGEIMGDSERHERAMKHLKKQKKAIASLEDLRKRKHEKYGPKEDEDDDA